MCLGFLYVNSERTVYDLGTKASQNWEYFILLRLSLSKRPKNKANFSGEKPSILISSVSDSLSLYMSTSPLAS